MNVGIVMASYKLVPYTVKIREKGNKDEFYSLDEIPIDGNKKHVNEIFADFLNKYNMEQFPDHEKTLYFSDVYQSVNKNMVRGRMNVGEYGINADFLNIETMEIEENARTEEDSEVLPFNFMFHAPADRDTAVNPKQGYLILQRFKNLGVKTVFSEAFEKYIEKISNDNLYVRIKPIISKELVEKLENADRIFEIELIKKKVPKSTAEKVELDNRGLKEKRTFIDSDGNGLPFNFNIEDIKDIFKNMEYISGELEDVEYYDDAKIRLEEGGSQNTVSILDEPEFRERLILNSEILNFNEDGFPTPESIQKRAIKYLEKFLERNGESSLGNLNEERIEIENVDN